MKVKETLRHNKGYKNPARYRLDFIKENTFNRVWSLHMTRARVIIVSAAIIAAGAALLWCIVAYTPVRQLLPGTLKGDLRADYIASAMKLDSLEQAAARNSAYINNISAIMQGEFTEPDTTVTPTLAVADSLLAAGEAERQFVRDYESQERFNLSVLAPIAAEGMIFTAPIGSTTPYELTPAKSLRITPTGTAPMASIYRGTVIGVVTGSDGLSTVTIQHPNDFVSVYTGLSDVFTLRGNRVEAGQRIGHAHAGATFELWHNGSILSPDLYINI